MSRLPRLNPVMLMPPPLLYAASFFLGLLLERLVPTAAQFGLERDGLAFGTVRIVGWLAIAAGLALAPTSAIRFLANKTTLNPGGRADVFVSNGAYRLTRNPMYLGLLAIYLGMAVLLSTPWPLATALIPLLILDRIVIPFEESQMTQRFGQAYLDYCGRVGRWLSLPQKASD